MSKSIKLQNNTYWDSASITHNKKILKEKLNDIDINLNDKLSASRSLVRLQWSMGDESTGSVNIDLNYAYLLINSHIYHRSISLITTHSNMIHQDVIFESDKASTPTVTLSESTLTITSLRQARIYLYKLAGCQCG